MGADAPRTKYLIANADEMEPGTFKDRMLIEGNPHQLIEGMILAAYAIQANISYVFLRWAYRYAAQLLQKSIQEAYGAGYLGVNILGSGYNLDMRLHTGVGLHCAPMAHRTINTYPTGTVRLSPGVFNTERDISYFLEALHSIIH